ncbi:MAG: hypothetical protein P8J37_20670 [Fuerstiella sp.]|nr:hypothetical protein [Fuerstiella sp.]
MRQLSISIVLFGLVGLGGCGGDGANTPTLGTVIGKVTVGGQPLADAVVTFTPVAGGRPSSGTTGSDGTYTLLYNVDNAGATIGQHTVMVTAGGEGAGDYEGDDPTVTEDEDEDEGEDEGEDEDEGDAGGLPAAAADGSLKKDVSAGANTINIEL